MSRFCFFFAAILIAAAAWAGSTSSLLPIVVLAPQTITQVSLSSNTVPAGIAAGAVVGSLGATMSPVNPAFLANGGRFSLSTSQGGCSTTNGAGNANFTVTGTSVKTAAALPAGNYAVCLLASEAGVLPVGLPVTIPANPPVTFNPTTIAFGTVAVGTTSSSQSVSITNVSGITLPVAAIAISGANGTDFAQTNTCPASLVVNGTCSASVTFTPSAAGARAASLSFQSVTGGPAFTVALSGTGSSSATPGFFVSATGSDTNPGTLASPFKSVQACQTAVRAATGANKTCNIRAGTYTGAGVGYTAVTTSGASGTVTEALYLTSADNGETWQEYAADFPSNGISTAIFDGGSAGNAANCPNSGAITGVHRGVYIDGASNVTINELQFQNFCLSGVSIHGNINVDCFPIAAGNATGNLVENNIVHDLSSGQGGCNGVFGGTGGIEIVGASSNTITHNVVYNETGMGIRAGVVGISAANQISNTTISNNMVYNVNTNDTDSGGIYLGQDQAATNIQITHNYIIGFGVYGCGTSNPGPGCVNGMYNDDGVSGVARSGNVIAGGSGSCLFDHGGNNNLASGNICDLGDVTRTTQFSSHAYITQAAASGNVSVGESNNVVIAKAAFCGPSGSTQCTYFNNGVPVSVAGPTGYFNYNAAGNWMTAQASGAGESSPVYVSPNFSCNTSGVDSWAFFIPAGNGVYSNPPAYPAQPANWGKAGFWGPPGFVNPHPSSVIAPSYIGSGVNGC